MMNPLFVMPQQSPYGMPIDVAIESGMEFYNSTARLMPPTQILEVQQSLMAWANIDMGDNGMIDGSLSSPLTKDYTPDMRAMIAGALMIDQQDDGAVNGSVLWNSYIQTNVNDIKSAVSEFVDDPNTHLFASVLSAAKLGNMVAPDSSSDDTAASLQDLLILRNHVIEKGDFARQFPQYFLTREIQADGLIRQRQLMAIDTLIQNFSRLSGSDGDPNRISMLDLSRYIPLPGL